MTTTLLFVGDMHIGRRPHRLTQFDIDDKAFAPSTAWQRVVDWAIEQKVAAVVLAGDVVDQDRDRYEAYAQLETGAQRLQAEEIKLVGVAGNHDGIVLPRLADRMPHFTLLGRGGDWELLSLPTEPPVDLLGWSFPTRHFAANPLAGGVDEPLTGRRDDAALLGVLHTDLDAGNSPYAPVSSAELAGVGADAFFLGHIHVPSALQGPRPLGYLGSLVGLHREETGWRGPWRVDVTGRGEVTATRLVLGPLRWEALTIDAGDIPGDDRAPDALHTEVARAMQLARDADATLADPAITVVGCSVEVTGRTASPARVRAAVAAIEADAEARFPLGEQTWVVVKWQVTVKPQVRLAQLAGQQNALGTLARLLLQLDEPDARPAEALMAAVNSARDPLLTTRWTTSTDDPPLPAPNAQLRAAGWRLLEVLLQQAEASS